MGKSSKAQRLRYASECKHEHTVVVEEYTCDECGAVCEPGALVLTWGGKPLSESTAIERLRDGCGGEVLDMYFDLRDRLGDDELAMAWVRQTADDVIAAGEQYRRELNEEFGLEEAS
jgi:hypothetical protein